MIRHQLIGGQADVGRIDHHVSMALLLEEKSCLSLNLVRAAADESVDCPQSQANIKV